MRNPESQFGRIFEYDFLECLSYRENSSIEVFLPQLRCKICVGLCRQCTDDGVDHGEMPSSLFTKTHEVSGNWPILKSTIKLICVRNLRIGFKFLHCQICKEAQFAAISHFVDYGENQLFDDHNYQDNCK